MMRNWNDVEKQLFTEDEIRESDLRVAIIGELIKARNEGEISQEQLEELVGVKQPVRTIESYTTVTNLQYTP